MKAIFTIILIALAGAAFSQKIVFKQDVKSDSVRPTNGPNLKNYKHYYFGVGFPFHTNEGKELAKPGTSFTLDFGLRYKRRFNNTLAMGFDLGLNANIYDIKKNSGFLSPDTSTRESFKISSLTPDVYLRLNVGRRGNYIGKYLDLGAYAGWNFRKAFRYKMKNDQDEMVKITVNRLSYIEDFDYGLLARIGYNRYVVFARYRLSDYFKSKVNFSELPRLTVGLEIGIF